jgi:predicted phage baseplate assembly protein
VGSGNIRARQYQAGGGLVGNVTSGAISQIMSGVLASGVSNPRAGEGGADGETPDLVLGRGPNVFRHQERSLSALDYETLAREASPAVAASRVLPATSPNGLPAAGWITVIVVPQSADPQPQPSFQLRQEVHDFLALRAPATVSAAKIAVIGPTYLPVGISAIVVPSDLSQAGTIEKAALLALASFLHPLTGGPDGTGWPFGRGVFISDVAAILEGIPGVDHAEFLELRLNDAPVGDSVVVPPDRMVVAGPLRIEIRGN